MQFFKKNAETERFITEEIKTWKTIGKLPKMTYTKSNTSYIYSAREYTDPCPWVVDEYGHG